MDNPVFINIEKFPCDHRILKIKQTRNYLILFSFKFITKGDISEEKLGLDTCEITPRDDVPTKFIKKINLHFFEICPSQL